MRITREAMFMEIANVVSKRATCFRLNVGAVIVQRSTQSVISIGYNGRPSGEPHCEGNACVGRFACQETVHAEKNAIDRVGVVCDILDMYCTDSPCQRCARVIANNGYVRRFFFQRPYRITDGIDDLIDEKIECFQVLPSGIVVDWKTKAIVNA